jgi:transcriptional regulator with XRE-family HTH domain
MSTKSQPQRAAESTAPLGQGFGARLRLARERAEMSVRELARRIGVSASLVSQVENGRVMPSVATLYAIANELGLLVDDLFRDTEPATDREAGLTAPHPGPVQRSETRKSIRLAAGVRWERLTPLPDDEVEFVYVVYEVGGASCEPDSLIRHGGKEYAYLISGRLGVQIGFEEYELRPGDSVTFDAQTPHRLWAIGDEPAVAVWVILNRHSDRRRRPEG